MAKKILTVVLWNVWVAFAILCAGGNLSAEVVGTISGYVTDPGGAVVPDATITATLVQQQMKQVVQTNAEGFYTFNALPPGSYTVMAEKSGFERIVRTGVTLALNQNVRLDFSLQVRADHPGSHGDRAGSGG